MFAEHGTSVHFRTVQEPAESVFLQPHMLEVTKEMAAKQPGTWANLFFAYRKPVIGFTRSEQRLAVGRLARWNGWRVV